MNGKVNEGFGSPWVLYITKSSEKENDYILQMSLIASVKYQLTL